MTKRGLQLICLTGGFLIIQGCANQPLERIVEEKTNEESSINTRADLRREAKDAIENATNLSTVQKTKLLALSETTQAKVDALSEEFLKLRSVLIKDLISTDYNENEVEAIKDKMTNISDKRLESFYTAANEAKVIMGNQASLNSEVIHPFIGAHRQGKNF